MTHPAAGGADSGKPVSEAARESRRAEIRAQLGGARYARLFAAVRARLEAGEGGSARTVTLTQLADDERRAIAGLLGWSRLPEPAVRLPLSALDAALRESRLSASLVETVEALGGTLGNRRAERAESASARQDLWTAAAAHPALAGNPELQVWLDELRRDGALARSVGADVAAQRQLLDAALTVVSRLPAGGRMLAVLASQATGNAHALDPGCALAAIVLRAAARLVQWDQAPRNAAERRRLWHAVGVVCDPLSVDVLTLGLRPAGTGRLPRHLRESSDDGEPRRITLRELGGCRLEGRAGEDVFVCENPSIVAAAADELGAACAPLVCVEGQPTTAALELLRALQAGGSRLRFHADFDWGGIRIGNVLVAALGAEAWRFSAVDYSKVELGTSTTLEGSMVRASWDPHLAEVMQAQGRPLFEEQVVDVLLGDLQRGERPSSDALRSRV